MPNGKPLEDEFEVLRRKAKQRATARTQEGEQAIKRRFAALGTFGSGAQIKQERLARQEAARTEAEEVGTIGAAEAREKRRRQEIEEQRGFAAEQAMLGREFARGERTSAQEFAAQQAGLGRTFAAEQAGLGRSFTAAQREAAQKFAAEQAGVGRQFAQTQAQAQREFAMSERMATHAFASAEAALGRDYATGEREAAQAFNQSMAELQISAGASEAEKQRAFASAETKLGRQFTREERQAAEQFNQQFADREFRENLKTNRINAILSGVNSGIDASEMNEFISSIGIDVDDQGNFIISGAGEGLGAGGRVAGADIGPAQESFFDKFSGQISEAFSGVGDKFRVGGRGL